MKRNNKTNKDIIKNTKAKAVKRPVKKEIDPKAVIKDISARGKKMFLTNRKTVSGFKKLTKNLAKLITEANQTGDQKLVGRITKLFGYLGFNTDSDANKVSWCFDAKVKPMKTPKAKPEKKQPEEKKPAEKPERKRRARKAKPDAVPAPEQQPAEEVPTVEEPTPEELEKLEGEQSPEVLAGDATDLANVEETGSVDDEPDGDEDEQEPNEEDEDPECDGDDSEDADEPEPQSYEEGLAEYRREAWGNGDFERDDI